jgi:hypothetical protein
VRYRRMVLLRRAGTGTHLADPLRRQHLVVDASRPRVTALLATFDDDYPPPNTCAVIRYRFWLPNARLTLLLTLSLGHMSRSLA